MCKNSKKNVYPKEKFRVPYEPVDFQIRSVVLVLFNLTKGKVWINLVSRGAVLSERRVYF